MGGATPGPMGFMRYSEQPLFPSASVDLHSNQAAHCMFCGKAQPGFATKSFFDFTLC